MRKLLLVLSLCFFMIFCWCIRSQAGISIYPNKTFVLKAKEIPHQVAKYKPSQVFLVYAKAYTPMPASKATFLAGDTIVDLSAFREAYTGSIAYRLIFKNKTEVDSLWQVDSTFRLTDKAYYKGENVFEFIAYNGERLIDRFSYDYSKKYAAEKKSIPSVEQFIRLTNLYTATDRNTYALGNTYIVSIGIDDYGDMKFYNCKTDAFTYDKFFTDQNLRFQQTQHGVQRYLLMDQHATKDSIIAVLREIAAKATFNDHFIFNFSGWSMLLSKDGGEKVTYFYPYDVTSVNGKVIVRKTKDTSIFDHVISLKLLQEYIQAIPANNQLFISEAGPSEKFKVEFIKTLMHNSPAIASILNKNRVIIVPNEFGKDDFYCLDNRIKKGPINYFITSLDTSLNIYNLFKNDHKAKEIEYILKSKAYNCKFSEKEYFTVFFEKEFLKQYNEVFGDDAGNATRGKVIGKTQFKNVPGVNGKRQALIIGTDNYKGKGWDKLNNPYYDAKEVAEELQYSYGFDVKLLKDPPMDSIYKSLREYYTQLQSNDQFIIYFAGHGDFDESLLDDGFVVCSDSRSVEDDPVRNSYIQHSKLKKIINKMPAKQVLVLLDICHGGVFDETILGGKSRNNSSSFTNMNVVQFVNDKAQYKVRRALSSVGKEAAFDGKEGKHSPFANLLLQVLRAKGQGTNGIVTLSHIYEVLQSASLNENASLKISPHVAKFGEDDPLGEFILIPVQQKEQQN